MYCKTLTTIKWDHQILIKLLNIVPFPQQNIETGHRRYTGYVLRNIDELAFYILRFMKL